MTHLFLFEWKFYFRTPLFYIMLTGFFILGYFTGTSAGISFPNITFNSPYAINFILGLFSLAALFPIVITSAQTILREKENGFDQILYATPLEAKKYLISRFCLVFGMAVVTICLFLIGYIIGHLTEIDSSDSWGKFHLSYYLNTLLILLLPNIFISSVVVSCVAWWTKNRIAVYLSGLGIYAMYMVVSIFSNSPLMAGASPSSKSSMAISAKIDPFGMAAFFEQTRFWSSLERNTIPLQLTGNLLFNRVLVLTIGFVLLFILFKYFRLNINTKSTRIKAKLLKKDTIKFSYHPTITKAKGLLYFILVVITFLKIDLLTILKSIPFKLLVLFTLFVLGMEMYGNIEGGVRLPQSYATSSLMANTILETLPVLLVLASIFYGGDLVWKSRNERIAPIEHSSPLSVPAILISKNISLFCIMLLIIISCLILGIIFQTGYGYYYYDYTIYASLLYLIGIPAALCGSIVIAIQYLVKHKYLSIAISAIFLILTNSSIGKLIGFSHPLLRFANFLPDSISDLTGLSYLSSAFILRMLYSGSIALLLSLGTLIIMKEKTRKIDIKFSLMMLTCVITLVVSSFQILNNSNNISEKKENDWLQKYEEIYMSFKNRDQPTITDVKTVIALYPEKRRYHVTGSYIIVNKTNKNISEILINTSKELKWNYLHSDELILIKYSYEFGQYLFRSKKQLLPNDSISLSFDFEYKIEALKGHNSSNSIVENGAFMRISRYFPSIGYDFDKEIRDTLERNIRKMRPLKTVTKYDEKIHEPYEYGFINLDAIISTSKDQSAMAPGILTKSSSNKSRNFFHYTARDIPFRFAVSSGKYLIKKENYHGTEIEIRYHSEHFQNIDHLMDQIKKSLNYCEKNFGKYPYKSLKFAEISNFTDGFAATAYPGCIYITEKYLHLNLKKDEGYDIINELAGHELSHQWWGNAQLRPDDREGSGILTETLAQYTELMLYKARHGEEKAKAIAELHQDLYDSEKAFSGEQALYNSSPENTNVIYNKGMVVMYQLYQLIGEESINKALKNLLNKHKFPLLPATSQDLINELKNVSPERYHRKIDNLFKT